MRRANYLFFTTQCEAALDFYTECGLVYRMWTWAGHVTGASWRSRHDARQRIHAGQSHARPLRGAGTSVLRLGQPRRRTDARLSSELANKDVGFVHKGQEVEIKVEAFTFTRYGLLHGHVTSLSQDVVAPPDASNSGPQGSRKDEDADAGDERDRQARQPTYVAHVALDALGVTTEDGFTPLEPGMAVTAEIKTGRRTVMSYLLSPLSRFKQEGLRER